MPAYKDSRQGTWYASFYFENWQGVKQKKLKRGFATKKNALAWEREFLLQQAADLTMTFEAFVEILYYGQEEATPGKHLVRQRAYHPNKNLAVFQRKAAQRDKATGCDRMAE